MMNNHVASTKFSIPKLKKIKRDLLTELRLDSYECLHEILLNVRKSFYYSLSDSHMQFTKVQVVNNPDLSTKYLEKKKEMKSLGYPDFLVADSYAFIPLHTLNEVENYSKNGVKNGNQSFSGLGVPSMAVHLCKHADVLYPSKSPSGCLQLLLVKFMKGKVKNIICKNGQQLEPTPNFDCHIAKANVEQCSVMPLPYLFCYSQIYVYEYGDFDLEEYPRHVLPYAVISYEVREPHHVPKSVLSVSAQSDLKSSIACNSENSTDFPNNEIWKGRLHVKLLEGGHIYIDVSMLSYFVPLTVNLLSPIKIHCLYPETNAQFTFFAGLSDIARKAEVPWREHFFQSSIIKPKAGSEKHFSALIRDITEKRALPTVRLPDDVFMFLMPHCLLSSQLGLVRSDNSSLLLNCVIMSKFSTIAAEKKHFGLFGPSKNNDNGGMATSWGELLEDFDVGQDESGDDMDIDYKLEHSVVKELFDKQRLVQNKFATMSIHDSEANFAPCGCSLPSYIVSKSKQTKRDADVKRIYMTIVASTESISPKKIEDKHISSASKRRMKKTVHGGAKSAASFSPNCSSDSESEDERRKKKRTGLSILNSTKTVEEELSEEDELTNEQMEAIIFMRKPPLTVKSRLTKNQNCVENSRELENKKSHKLSVKPKIIPIERNIALNHNDNISQNPKIIPTEPIESSCVVENIPLKETSESKPVSKTPMPVSRTAEIKEEFHPKSNDVKPRSILKSTLNSPSKPEDPCMLENDSNNEKNNSSVKPSANFKQLVKPKSILKKSSAPINASKECLKLNANPTFENAIIKQEYKLLEPDALYSKTSLDQSSSLNDCKDIDLPKVTSNLPNDNRNELNDVDMRIQPFLNQLPAPFANAKDPPFHLFSPPKTGVRSLGRNRLLGDIYSLPALMPKASPESQFSLESPVVKYPLESPMSPEVNCLIESPMSPVVNLPLESPMSPDANGPVESPMSPEIICPLESPMSPPPPPLQTESPASPPPMDHPADPPTTPVSIPTVRMKNSPPSSPLSPVNNSPNSFLLVKRSQNEDIDGINNADDMNSFLNYNVLLEIPDSSVNRDDK